MNYTFSNDCLSVFTAGFLCTQALCSTTSTEYYLYQESMSSYTECLVMNEMEIQAYFFPFQVVDPNNKFLFPTRDLLTE